MPNVAVDFHIFTMTPLLSRCLAKRATFIVFGRFFMRTAGRALHSLNRIIFVMRDDRRQMRSHIYATRCRGRAIIDIDYLAAGDARRAA